MDNRAGTRVEHRFQELCAQVGRRGIIGFSPVEGVHLLAQQAAYLSQRLAGLPPAAELTAVSIGLLYHPEEILAVPSSWQAKPDAEGHWNRYAHAYHQLNQSLGDISAALAAEFGGVAEKATIEGWAGTVGYVDEYFPHCISHRSFAEAAGLGWRGRHSLIVTPEAGPALRFATVFLPGRLPTRQQELPGCGDCQACLEVCPILRHGGDYREACRRRIHALGLEADVCGICVRVCWEQVAERSG